MKKNEIALLLVIVGIVAMATYFIANSMLSSGGKPKTVKVKTAQLISPTVTQPNQAVFMDGAYNPTVKAKIGDQANQQPFNGQ